MQASLSPATAAVPAGDCMPPSRRPPRLSRPGLQTGGEQVRGSRRPPRLSRPELQTGGEQVRGRRAAVQSSRAGGGGARAASSGVEAGGAGKSKGSGAASSKLGRRTVERCLGADTGHRALSRHRELPVQLTCGSALFPAHTAEKEQTSSSVT
jgi:hypothetical protein